ncbi:MAG: hypothetical protein VXY81_12215 [Pseudomonadota bacterium]|nr:hypothetical protein [Pseudomonadota bacterium]
MADSLIAWRVAARRRARADRRRSAKERCRFRVDYMHMPQIGHQRHALASVAGRRRGHPRANFDGPDIEEHHGFHAHRLNHVEKGVKLNACGGAFKRR